MAGNKSMQEYLKRYMSDGEQPAKKKRKKKRQDGPRAKRVENVVIRDTDADWAAAVDDGPDDPAFVDGSAMLAAGYDDGPVVYNPGEMVDIERHAGKEFKGRDTFRSVDSPEASAAATAASRHDSDDDSDDAAPPRRGQRHDSDDDDASPPRRGQRHDSDDDDASPPRRGQRHDSDGDDASPPRHRARADSDGDASPPRRAATAAAGDERRRHVVAAEEADPEPLGGLRTASELRVENERKRREIDAAFRRMGAASGVGQETVHRDKDGRRVDPKLERIRKRQEEAKEREKVEAKMKWGRGLSQLEEAKQKAMEEAYEASKPFARGKDDADMNRALKDELRADDPMRAYIENEREKAAKAAGVKVKPKYKGSWPANRYMIPPGHRWDGRDRSNGFEAKMALRQNAKTARDKDAYKWSSEAM